MKTIGKYIAVFISVCLMAACGGSDDSDSPFNPGEEPGNGGVPKVYTQSITVPAQGGEQSMTLIDLKSAINSISNTPSWVVVSPKDYTSGSPSIKLVVEENDTKTERRGEAVILAVSGDKVVLTVIQQAAGNENTKPGSGIDDPHNEQTDQPAYARQR